jgi:hypothetical protein
MKCPALLLVALLSAGGGAEAERPQVLFSGGRLSLRTLPTVLSEEVVSKHLGTGLTTVFVFTVDAGRVLGRPVKGEAQVRIRYDLWDERYVTERWDARQDSPVAVTLARTELLSWWRSLTLLVHAAAPGLRAPPGKVKVELLVLPFSQAEQRDAQDWLLQSFRPPEVPIEPRRPNQGATPAPEVPIGPREPIRELYGAMLAASIGQRSLITYSWTVAVTAE